MKVYAIIADKTDKWKEDFDVPENYNSEEYIRNIVDKFNATLKPGETPRQLISIEKRVSYKDMTNYKLFTELKELTSKQLIKLSSSLYWFDEIDEYEVRNKFYYIKKNINNIQLLLNCFSLMTDRIKIDTIEEAFLEAKKRGWKSLVNRKFRNKED